MLLYCFRMRVQWKFGNKRILFPGARWLKSTRSLYPVFGEPSFTEMLAELNRYPQIPMLELGTGGWPGATHIDVDALLARPDHAIAILRPGPYDQRILLPRDPFHQQQEIAKRDDATFRRTVKLAELLGVPVGSQYLRYLR
jgi:hypothetical protein